MKNIVGECLCNVLKNKGEVYLNDKKKKAKEDIKNNNDENNVDVNIDLDDEVENLLKANMKLTIVKTVVENLTPENVNELINIMFNNEHIKRLKQDIKDKREHQKQMKMIVNKFKYDFKQYMEQNSDICEEEIDNITEEVYDNIVNLNDYR